MATLGYSLPHICCITYITMSRKDEYNTRYYYTIGIVINLWGMYTICDNLLDTGIMSTLPLWSRAELIEVKYEQWTRLVLWPRAEPIQVKYEQWTRLPLWPRAELIQVEYEHWTRLTLWPRAKLAEWNMNNEHVCYYDRELNRVKWNVNNEYVCHFVRELNWFSKKWTMNTFAILTASWTDSSKISFIRMNILIENISK